MSRVFAPSLGAMVAEAARSPSGDADPAEVARVTLEMARRTGSTHILFPFDARALASAIGEPDKLADVEPEALCGEGSVAAIIEAARFLARVQPVAAHVPSPDMLVLQLGADPGDRDQAEAADDICTTFARHLLDAGARLLVAVASSRQSDASLTPLKRLAEVFDADFVVAGGDHSEVARLTVADVLAGTRAGAVAGSARVVLTDDPLPPDADLAAVMAAAKSIVSEPA